MIFRIINLSAILIFSLVSTLVHSHLYGAEQVPLSLSFQRLNLLSLSHKPPRSRLFSSCLSLSSLSVNQPESHPSSRSIRNGQNPPNSLISLRASNPIVKLPKPKLSTSTLSRARPRLCSSSLNQPRVRPRSLRSTRG